MTKLQSISADLLNENIALRKHYHERTNDISHII